MTPPKSLIDPKLAAFMQGGVSIVVASRGIQNVPSLVRAIGCRVSPDRSTVRVLVPLAQSKPLLEDLRANGAIAVVFNQPTTHRAFQLKGADASVAPLEDGDLAAVAAYGEAMVVEVAQVGFREPATRALLTCPATSVVPIVFTPNAVYCQTPGPDAGVAVAAGA